MYKRLGAALLTGTLLVVVAVQTYYILQLRNQLEDMVRIQTDVPMRPPARKPIAFKPSQLAGWNPYEEMESIQKEMNRLFHDSFGRGLRQSSAGWTDLNLFDPQVDLKETPQEYIFTMDIPGMEKDQINVEAQGQVLVVSGERREETAEQANRFSRRERSFGYFSRALSLPEDANPQGITAEYKNGVLVIRVARQTAPESAAAKPPSQKIPVQ